MLSLLRYQPFISPFAGIYCPMRSLWPEITPLYRHTDILQKLQHKIFEEIQLHSEEIYPTTCTTVKEGGGFALTLDTTDFSPEELSVRQVGRKLHVSGKTEKKQEDGKGSYSSRIQEFRRVFDLPEGVKPEAVTCCMAVRKLHIQAPVSQLSKAPERMIPTDCRESDMMQTETTNTQNDAPETQETQESSKL